MSRGQDYNRHWINTDMKEIIENSTSEFNPERFVRAQDDGDPGTYASAINDLRSGRKRGHWMWYVFPQIVGLGSSGHNFKYAINSIEEARAYLAHPVIGNRLTEAVQAVLDIDGKTALDIFGEPDRSKLRSSMTLFEQVSGKDSVFYRVLEKYFEGERDGRTLEILENAGR